MRQPTRAELRDAIHRGDIDTVVMAFPDLQGRLVGKRTSGTFFLQQVEEHGTENCDYLIATDFDDVAVPGYKFASYDLGYGDMVARADFGTIRFTPWVPKTALIFCDVFSVKTGEPIAVAPRQILRDQVAAAQRMNLEPMIGSEIEFYLFRDSYDQLHDKGYRNLL
ncbi:MAG: glutamine synthetase, partial [Ilumatobacteraceae bacterium]